MRNAAERRLQGMISSLCACIFAIFAFTFIAFYKSAELEVAYDYIAIGRLQYNGYVIAAVSTALLVGLALWLNRIAGFKREWTAMAYIPSALIAAFLTDVDRTLFTGEHTLLWLWIFCGGIFIYVFFSIVLNRMLFEKIKDPSMVANRIIWRNLILFMLMFLAVGSLSGGDKNFKREALQYRLFKSGALEEAIAVGGHSPMASPQLSAQRAFLLSLKGELAEHYFDYPLYCGAESLLPSVERDAPIPSDTVYSHIGAKRKPGEDALGFLARAVAENPSSVVPREYYLVALLAERRLVDFADKLFEYYNVGDVNTLPKQYKEALMLYAYIVPGFDVKVNDRAMSGRFETFIRTIRQSGVAPWLNIHLLRVDYNDTYWCYFLCGE